MRLDENNQYEQTTTKPLLYGCIKKQGLVPSLLELNKILDRISHEDPVGHPLMDRGNKSASWNGRLDIEV